MEAKLAVAVAVALTPQPRATRLMAVPRWEVILWLTAAPRPWRLRVMLAARTRELPQMLFLAAEAP